jgi:ribosomal-protein-alanine N-acetyltransferase
MVFDELHINSLAVDEPWRRRGLARVLLKSVIGDAVAAGARAATLEVRQSNVAARALYEGLGFHVEGVRRDYYQQPREDALILWNRRL